MQCFFFAIWKNCMSKNETVWSERVNDLVMFLSNNIGVHILLHIFNIYKRSHWLLYICFRHVYRAYPCLLQVLICDYITSLSYVSLYVTILDIVFHMSVYMWLFKISLPFICLFTCDYKILSVICLYMWLVDIFCHVCLYVTVKNIVLHILAKRQCLSCVCLCMTAECVLVFQMFVYVCFAKHVVPFIFLFIYVTLSRVTCVHTSFYVCLQNMSSLMCLFVCLYMFVCLYIHVCRFIYVWESNTRQKEMKI